MWQRRRKGQNNKSEGTFPIYSSRSKMFALARSRELQVSRVAETQLPESPLLPRVCKKAETKLEPDTDTLIWGLASQPAP